MPKSRTGVWTPGVAQHLRQPRPDAADPDVVLDVTTSRWPPRQVEERRGDRIDPPRVDDGDADPLAGQAFARPRARAPAIAPTTRQHVGSRHRGRSTSTPSTTLEGRDVRRHGALGEPQHGRARRRPRPPRAAAPAAARRPAGRRGAGPGRAGASTRSHMPLWLGAVVAGDPGAVEHEGDAGPVQRARPSAPGRTPGSGTSRRRRRPGAARRTPCPAADVTACCSAMPTSYSAVRERAGELLEAGRPQHRGGDRHDVGSLAADSDELIGEHRGPRRTAGGQRQAGLRVDARRRRGTGRPLSARPARSPGPSAVITCTITGAAEARARRSACSTASTSWPSTGPTYFRPRSSNMPCGATMSLRPFLTPCSVVVERRARPPGCGRGPPCPTRGSARSRGVVRSVARWCARPPIVGE